MEVANSQANTLSLLSPRSRVPVLNLDILFVVASFCRRETLCRLMKTCKALYRTAARYLLENEPSVRINGGSLGPFLRFMTADNGRRWTSLQGIEVYGNVVPGHLSGEFATEVRKATNLKQLIFSNPENFLESHPDLTLALASLPRVQELKLERIDWHTCQMLKAMRWPLESAVLSHSLDGPRYEGRLRSDPMRLLKNSRRTLQKLHLESWMHCAPTVYPEMKELRLVLTPGSLTNSVSWARSYPNLARIEVVFPHCFDCDARTERDIIWCRRIREANRQAHLSQGTWPRLKSFSSTGIHSLYTAGFPCEIEHVSTRISHLVEMALLPEAMADARPARLELNGLCRVLLHTDADSQWVDGCFCLPAMENLRHLKIYLPVVILEGPSDLKRFFDRLIDALDALHLTTFACTLCVYEPPHKDPADGTLRSAFHPPRCPTEAYLVTFDAHTLAERLLQAAPSLTSVCVSLVYAAERENSDQKVELGQHHSFDSGLDMETPDDESDSDSDW